MPASFELSRTFVHLGHPATAVPVPDFQWTEEFLERYSATFAADGAEGRLVALLEHRESWTSWERHPAGDEVVAIVSGRVDLIQDVDGAEVRIALGPGEAAINPAGTWHRCDVYEPGAGIYITPGAGTEHRPYVADPA